MAEFKSGLDNTILVNGAKGFSYIGPWKEVNENTVVDRFYVGDFTSATYYISVQFDSNSKEAMQVNVVASPLQASLIVVGRTGTDGVKLVNLSAEVNASNFELIANPVEGFEASKIMFSATYIGTIDTLTPPQE